MQADFIECTRGCGTLWPAADKADPRDNHVYPAVRDGRLVCNVCGDGVLVHGETAVAEERRLLAGAPEPMDAVRAVLSRWRAEVASRQLPLSASATMMKSCAGELEDALAGGAPLAPAARLSLIADLVAGLPASEEKTEAHHLSLGHGADVLSLVQSLPGFWQGRVTSYAQVQIGKLVIGAWGPRRQPEPEALPAATPLTDGISAGVRL